MVDGFVRFVVPMKEFRKILGLLVASVLAVPGQAALDRRTPVVEAVQKALPSVVNIGTMRSVKVVYRDPFYNLRAMALGGLLPRDMPVPPPITRERVERSLGSGVVVDPDGYILTNYHVVEQAARVRVMLGDNEAYDATLLAGDPLNDLALLKIEAPYPLRAISFAADDDLLLGETVIALGNPFGFSQTVTVGVLSGINREATYDNRVVYRDILQTDAAFNYGSSGGPLLNINGDMIGLNVQILQDAQNIGFAVPIKRARALLGRWLSARQLRHFWLGFEPVLTNGILRIAEVETGGAAGRAGLQPGDQVTALDGQPVGDLFGFNRALLPRALGDEVRVSVRNEQDEREVALPVTNVPQLSGDQLARRLLGLALSADTPAPAIKAGFHNGLGIESILPGGAAQQSGLPAGLLVTRINDTEIRSPADVADALQRVQRGDKVTLKLMHLVEQKDFIVAEILYWDLEAG